MKKLSAVALALSLIILAGCAEEDKYYDKVIEDFGVITGVESYVVNSSTSCFNDLNVRYHGRYYEDTAANAVWISFTDAGFEVTFKGTVLEGDFLATRADDVKSKPYVAVTVDGDYDPDHAVPVQFSTNGKYANGTTIAGGISEHKHVVLCHGLTDGVHTVRVYKRSECQNSRLALRSLSTDGEILPVQAKEFDLKLEFFGDSVTCGYAVESDDFFENFTTRTENGMKTYANYAANLLNADISVVSSGGYPLYRSIYSENNNPSDVPSLFSMAEFEYQTSFDHPWDNSKYIPDAVIVALGANDGSVLSKYTAGSKEYNEFLDNFRAAYYAFADKIYAAYPDTLLVISDEILNIGVFSTIADEVADTLSKSGKKVVRAKYNAEALSKDRTYPGAGHPNAEMQMIAGYELAKVIADYLGIEYSDGGFFDKYAA